MRQVMKRDGRVVQYDIRRIKAAVMGAMTEVGEGSKTGADLVAMSVEDALVRAGTEAASVEYIQDECERQLMLSGFVAAAKAFVLYRARRTARRSAEDLVPEDFRALTAESRDFFSGPLSELVYYRTYSRWRPDLGRREAWPETVARYMSFMHEKLGARLHPMEYAECERAIINMEVMPSMRLMWSAGDAARATNVAAFNCSYIAPQEPRDFGETLYILACGTGVGFSSESRNVQALPVVRRNSGSMLPYEVDDSKEGWAEALRIGLETWYGGGDMEYDFRGIRPMGARLLTMGGRASGPGPLKEMLAFARGLMLRRQKRRLANIDVHDLVCKIGDCIVSGGVRRSALISLSDLDDVAIRGAKSGPYGSWPKHRELANNSAVYDERPSSTEFMREWLALAESGSGERGIFNRGDMLDQIPARRVRAWQEMGHVDERVRLLAQVGTNPCGEINLLHKQFCNLTEVVCRHGDDFESLLRKVRIAAVLGTYQSTLTDYPYLSREWRENCERERLLGVSLTGQWDCPEVMDDRGSMLMQLSEEAVITNVGLAERLGIPASTAVTCGKPSGTVSQLVNASSGGHARFAPFYIRRILISSTDPLCRLLRDAKVPCAPKSGESAEDASAWAFEFPERAPPGSTCAASVSGLGQLEHWLKMKSSFTEHNPSVSVYVGEDEWVDVGHWVWRHFKAVGGLSFFPRSNGHVYPQAPFEEVTEAEYGRRMAEFPTIDYSLLAAYEKEDNTSGSKELACAAGACEI